MRRENKKRPSDVLAMTGEPISTSVVIGVLAVALLVGFAIGYVGSDVAGGDGGTKTVVENNGNGDVIVDNK